VKIGRHFANLYKGEIPNSWGCWSNSKNGKGPGYWLPS
jgi:hypothetical protein